MGRGHVIDLTGKIFGRLKVISRAENIRTSAAWNCKCECGNEVVRSGGNLRLKQSLSCGCLKQEKLVSRNRSGLVNDTKSQQYQHWRSMVRRCHDEKSSNFKNYGAKGTVVCDRWRYSYSNFVADMGARPKGKSIDRIDNNKGYSPENCRWATSKEQGSNRRNVPLININGIEMTYPDACKHYGIKYETFKNRTNTLGWSVLAALTEPVVPRSAARSRRGLPKP